MSPPYLQQDKELEDPPERRREQPGIRHCHLEEEGVKKSVSDIDEWVLVYVRVSYPVRPNIVVKWNVVVPVALIFRHFKSLDSTVTGKSTLFPQLVLGQSCGAERTGTNISAISLVLNAT